MAHTTVRIALLMIAIQFLSGCTTFLRPDFVGASYAESYAGGGSVDGLFLLLLIGVAIAGISWRPDAGDSVG